MWNIAEVDLRSKSLGSASACLGGLFPSVLWRRRGFEGVKETHRAGGDFIDGSIEGLFIRSRRLVKSADLSHKLQRSVSNLVRSHRRIKVEQRFYIPAHQQWPPDMTKA
jgi:hypothetical protein